MKSVPRQPPLSVSQRPSSATVRSSRPASAAGGVPSLPLDAASFRSSAAPAASRDMAKSQSMASGLTSSSSSGSVAPLAVGPTLLPSPHYRAPAGTTLNKIPHSARAQLQIEMAQADTRDRLRAKNWERKAREEQARQERLAALALASQQKVLPGQRTKRSAKSKTASQRQHYPQQQGVDSSYVSREEMAALAQPYQSVRVARPQSASVGAYPTATSDGSYSASPHSMKLGRPYEPADKAGQLVSASTMSRLTPQQIAAQRAAGKPSDGCRGQLAEILGGGHEYVVFGKKNAPSAETRVSVSLPAGAAPPVQEEKEALNYAPWATSVLPLHPSPVKKFNDQRSGAVMVIDDVDQAPRHASAAIGYGKRHPGFKEYVARPAAESMLQREERAGSSTTAVTDPFRANNNLLSWHTDGITRRSHADELARTRQQAWSRTNADYGQHPALSDRPVAGRSTASHEGWSLAHVEQENVESQPLAQTTQADAVSSRTTQRPATAHKHVHKQTQVKATSSSGNPLNPYSAEELANLSRRPAHLSASAIGFGKGHEAYKTFVLAGQAKQQLQASSH